MEKEYDDLALDVKNQFMQQLDLLTQDISSDFVKINDVTNDDKLKETLANQISQYILKDVKYNIEAVWKEEAIHEKILILKKRIHKASDPPNKKLWRPKNGDIKQQLRSLSMQKKSLYKSFLEEQLLKKKKGVSILKNEVSQLRVDFDNKRGQAEKLPMINNMLKKKIIFHFKGISNNQKA